MPNSHESIYGNLPTHWDLLEVRDLVSDGRAVLQTGPFGTMLHASSYASMGTPVVAVKNIGDNRLIHDGIPRVDSSDLERLERYKLKEGDILFGRKGDVERRALIRAGEADWLQGSDCIRLRILTKQIEPKYISYVLGTRAYREWILRNAQGATMPSLNQEIIGRIPLPLPKLSEQRAIVRILGTLDDKIESNLRVNETLEAVARAIFKSWFVDFEPVHAKAEGRNLGLPNHVAASFPHLFQESPLGRIPEGWRVTTLGLEADRCGGHIQTGPFGSQLHASDYVVEGVPVVMPKNISNRRVSTEGIARVKEVDAQRLSKHRLEVGDVVYSRRGDVERHAWIGKNEAGWLCGTGCLLVRMGPRSPAPVFASLALDRPESRAWITQHAIGATMPNLNTGILSAFPFIVPPDDVLRAFAGLIDPIELLISAGNSQSHTLATLRDTLLPRLISGEVRLKECEEAIS